MIQLSSNFWTPNTQMNEKDGFHVLPVNKVVHYCGLKGGVAIDSNCWRSSSSFFEVSKVKNVVSLSVGLNLFLESKIIVGTNNLQQWQSCNQINACILNYCRHVEMTKYWRTGFNVWGVREDKKEKMKETCLSK